MSDGKLTKNELKDQQDKLNQLERYLPTLLLKKAMLQVEVNKAQSEVEELKDNFHREKERVEGFSALLQRSTAVDPEYATKVEKILKSAENIAGVEIPIYEGVDFPQLSYNLFETPPWVDGAIKALREMVAAQARVLVGEAKVDALAQELRQVSIRVNLFEKRLIPRAKAMIRKIKVFLGDQQLAAVSQAKVAKAKIEERGK
ncbi:MAG: V-type ATP synthase subunit D [Chlamydiota bacterium]